MGFSEYGIEDNFNSGYQTNGFDTSLNSNIISSGNNGSNGFQYMSPELESLQMDNLRLQNEQLGIQMDKQNSFGSTMSPYMQGFANLAGGASSIAGIYTGFKQLGLMEDQVGIAKEQWKETKTELARVKKVRSELNSSYA